MYPKPAIVLACDQQLCDLDRFCCDPSEFSALTIDPTFSLGDFDVTPTAYHHLLLHSKHTNKPPVCLGPIMVHYRKNFQTFLHVLCFLYGWPEQGLRVFCTDSEKALINAKLKSMDLSLLCT